MSSIKTEMSEPKSYEIRHLRVTEIRWPSEKVGLSIAPSKVKDPADNSSTVSLEWEELLPVDQKIWEREHYDEWIDGQAYKWFVCSGDAKEDIPDLETLQKLSESRGAIL